MIAVLIDVAGLEQRKILNATQKHDLLQNSTAQSHFESEKFPEVCQS